MGANNSINALLKVSEGIASGGISNQSGYFASTGKNAMVDISDSNSDWQYFVEYEKVNSSTSINLVNSKPTPKHLSHNINSFLIIDHNGIDGRKLKNIAKSEVAGCIFEIQHDDAFCKWIEDLHQHISACEVNSAVEILTPVVLANIINSVIEMHLTPESLMDNTGSVCDYANIGSRTISIKDTCYPINLYDYARQSVQHSYVANIAGFLLSILKDNSATAFIADELIIQADSTRRLDSLIFLIVIAILVAIIVVGGYSIFTVMVNETHHSTGKKWK